MENAGAIASPDGLRALIESVYGEDADAQLPDALQGSFFDTLGRAGAEQGIATTNLLNFSKGYVRDGGAWDSDVRTPTRLNDDPQVTLRLARVSDGRVVPYAHDAATNEPWRAWRLSEVSVAARQVGGEILPLARSDDASVAKADWTRFDADKILVVLERNGGAGETAFGEAAAGNERGGLTRISYDSIRGLELSQEP